MTVIICPGVHAPQLTESFLEGLGGQITDYLIVPSEIAPPYSALHVLDFLRRQFVIPHPVTPCSTLAQVPLLFVGFSAGVVGAIGAAWGWQSIGRTVKALIALDGWGVPLYGSFPIYRLSHDAFTHYSSAAWGTTRGSFYADPPIPHLELWRSPQTVQGWHVSPAGSRRSHHYSGDRSPTTAAEFLVALLAQHGEITPT